MRYCYWSLQVILPFSHCCKQWLGPFPQVCSPCGPWYSAMSATTLSGSLPYVKLSYKLADQIPRHNKVNYFQPSWGESSKVPRHISPKTRWSLRQQPTTGAEFTVFSQVSPTGHGTEKGTLRCSSKQPAHWVEASLCQAVGDVPWERGMLAILPTSCDLCI